MNHDPFGTGAWSKDSDRARSRRGRVIVAILSTTMVTTGITAASIAVAPKASGAIPGQGSDFDCYGGTIYTVQRGSNSDSGQDTTDGSLWAIPTTDLSGASPITDTLVTTIPNGGFTNALGITQGGSAAYVVDQTTDGGATTVNVFGYDALTSAWTTYTGTAGANDEFVAGAVSPNGIYYYADFGASGVATIYGFDTTTNTAIPGIIATTTLPLSSMGAANGDLAFDQAGDMFIISSLGTDAGLGVVHGPIPTTGSGTPPSLTDTTLSTYSDPSSFGYNGIAFDNYGHLYIQYANGGTEDSYILEINPNSGATIAGPAQQNTSTYPNVDLGACSLNPTLTVQKDITSRAAPSDEFGLSITGGSITMGNTATTTGSSTGVQSEVAGPVVGVSGTTYTVAETATNNDLADYSTTYSCIDQADSDNVVASGSGQSFDLDFPDPANLDTGPFVLCTFTNAAEVNSLTVSKSSTTTDIQSIGQVVPYSFLVTNTGQTTLTSISVTDTQSAPSSNASLSVIDCPSSSLAAGTNETCTATYTVTAADITNGSLADSATATGTPPAGPPITSPPSTLSIPASSITIVKSASPTLISAPGQSVDYSFLVTNTGQTTLTSISVTDTQTAPSSNASLSVIDCPSSSLSAGTNETCTATYTVSAADFTNGSIDDSATATGTPPSSTPITSAPSTATVDVATSSITIVKSASPTVVSAAGQSIDYSFLVTDTGQTTLTSISVTDTQSAPSSNASLSVIDCPSSTLSAGTNETCTATYTVSAADITNGTIDDSATVTGTPPSLTPVTSAPSTTSVDVAGLTVVKSSTTTDIQSIGQVVPYSFLVTNTGQTTLTSISVTDTQSAPSSNASLSVIDCPSSSLAAGTNETCTATYTVTAADITNGSLADSATATGTPPAGPPITSPPSTLSIPASSITIVKSASPTLISAPGQSVDYSFLVTNTGQTTLTSISVTDTQTAPSSNASLSVIDCPSSSLSAGTNETCTATYTVSAADFTNGSIDDSATATGTPPSSTPITSAPSTATVDVATSSITIVKSASPTVVSAAGQSIDYSFLVTDTGQTTLTSISVTDTQSAPSSNASLSVIDCPSSTLSAGTNETCTATYTVSAADITNGTIDDSATVTGTPPSLTPVTSAPSTTSVDVAGLTVVKSSTTTDIQSIGQVVPYSFLVTNTGQTTLTSISVTDTQSAPSSNASLSVIDCPSSSLAAGTNETCTATYTVTAADITNGSLADSATATGTPPAGPPITSPPSTLSIPASSITIVKSASPTLISAPGQSVDYSFLVTNTGQTTLTSISVTDTQTAPSSNASLSVIDCPSSSLSAGTNETCTATYTVSAADFTNGSIDDSATATGTPPSSTPITSAPSTATVDVATSSITIVKSASPTVVSAAGQSIDYSFLVTDTGQTTLTSISVTDTQSAPSSNASLSVIDCPSSTLSAGTNETCTATYTVSAADITNGTIDDSATVTGTPPSLTPVTSAPSTTSVDVAGLTVVKSSTTTDIQSIGQVVPYSFLVTNTGQTTLTSISVTDTQSAPSSNASLSVIDCPSSSLAAGTNETCTATYTVTAADITNGSLADSATATGTPPAGPPITSPPSTLSIPASSITIVKSASPTLISAPGQSVDYSFLVTNTGQTTLTSISVTDTQTAPSSNASLSVIDCPSSSLSAGTNETCTATYTVSAADFTNGSIDDSATATGTPPSSTPITSAPSTATVDVATSSITIVKSASPTVVSAAGQSIDYSFLVTDTGQTTLTSISVTDTQSAPSSNASLSVIDCPSSTLSAGTNETCTATYTVSAADITNGTIDDSATATGTPPSLTPVTSAPSTTSVDVAGLTVVKSSTTTDIQSIGQVVPYSFLVTNTGQTTLTSISVTDTQSAPSSNASLSVIDCPSSSLAAGTNETCTATYTVTAADITNGSLADSATATGTPPAGPPITSPPSTLSIPASSITIVKSTTTTLVTVVGQTVSFSYLVTNSGQTTLTSISVGDFPGSRATGSALTPPTCPQPTLAAGANEVCTSSYTVTAADIAAGSVVDTAVATGTSPSSTPVVSDPSTVTVPASQVPALTILKTTSAATVSAAGQLVQYSFLVTNHSNQTLTGLSVVDTQVPPSVASSLSAIDCPQASLTAGTSEICTATYTVTAADVAHGSVADSAVVSGRVESSPGGQPPPTATSSSSAAALPFVAGAPEAAKSPITPTVVNVTG